MKNNIIILEILKRQKCKDENHSEIGLEIKYRREKRSLTLEEVSGNTCSLSYLWKLENNKIDANHFYLEEICKKVDLTENEIERLFQLDGYLASAISAFIENDKALLKKIYDSVVCFYNYKSKLIQFIYFISVGDYIEADEISKEINRIVGGMTDSDIVYYSSIYASFRQKNGDYIEALDVISSLGNFYHQNQMLTLLNEMTKFKCLFMLGDNSIFQVYYSICDMLANTAGYYKLERYNYYINIFMIHNNCRNLLLNSFLTDESKKNILLLKKIIEGGKPKYSEAKEATGMARLWALSIIDKKRCLEELEKYRGTDIEMDFSIYIIEYNLLNDNEEKYSYIANKIIPVLRANNAFYLKKFFLNELAYLSKVSAKYKLFNYAYLEFAK